MIQVIEGVNLETIMLWSLKLESSPREINAFLLEF